MCGVLIKHCRKVKGEQVITLQRVSLKPPINRPPTTDHLPTDRPTTDQKHRPPTNRSSTNKKYEDQTKFEYIFDITYDFK